MKALFYTREFPPYVYGGAGVHVEYLAGELAKLMEMDVRCFGDQDDKSPNLTVKGYPDDKAIFKESNDKLKSVFKTLSTSSSVNSSPLALSSISLFFRPESKNLKTTTLKASRSF